MFVTIFDVVISITAFSITKKPMKTEPQNGLNHGNTKKDNLPTNITQNCKAEELTKKD
jgi:hypothetical protein